MIEKTLEKIPVSELIPYENNPRLNENAVEDVMESIRQCENLDPIEIDEDNVILAGHTRRLALKRMGVKETEVIRYAGLTEEQKKKYRLLSNKTNEKSLWDFDKLEAELTELDFEGFDFGFDIDDIEIDENELAEIVEDERPEKAETRCKVGDIWECGKHRLICGDSTDVSVVERLMDGAKADLYITDPPYNVDYEGKTKDALRIQNDKMDNDSFRQFLKDAFLSADTVMRNGAVFYIWHADSEGYNFRGACLDAGWKVRECLIWNKNSMVLGRQDYQWKHEPCLYGWKDGASHLWQADRKQVTVLDFNRPNRNGEHPTMKPVELFAYQISNNTHENDNVLDSFGGSGTTLIACEQLNRKCYICELDEHYCDVIIQRWENLTGERAVLVEE